MGQLNQLSVLQIDGLVEALLACGVLQTLKGRQQVIGDLREIPGVDAIPEDSAASGHVRNIVKALDDRGQMSKLIYRVLYYEGGTKSSHELMIAFHEVQQNLFDAEILGAVRTAFANLQLPEATAKRLFSECAQGLTSLRDTPRDSYDMALLLAGFPPQHRGFPYPAIEFIERVALSAPASAPQLRAIADSLAGVRGIKGQLAAGRLEGWKLATGQAVLLFELNPKGNGFLVRALLWMADSLEPVTLCVQDAPVDENRAQELFRTSVAKAEQRSTNLLIQFAVKREMLCCPADQWDIDVAGYPARVGGQYPVVVRCLDRLLDTRYEPRWKEKWKAVKFYAGQPLWLHRADEFQPRTLLAKLGQNAASGTFVSFAFIPSARPLPQGDPLSVLLSGGTPIAVWWRNCDPDPVKARAELEKLLAYESLEDLPALLKRIRNQADQENDPDHPGCRLTLLFDDYDHRPNALPG
jgi:hypothetical protein